MAAGTVQQGSDCVVYVETAPGVFTIVNDLNKISKKSDRSSNTYPVFGKTVPYQVNGQKVQSFDLSGFLSVGDTGQDKLRAVEAADTAVTIRVLFDGANGFTQSIKVQSYTFDATPEGLQECGFTATVQADAVIVGTGPIL